MSAKTYPIVQAEVGHSTALTQTETVQAAVMSRKDWMAVVDRTLKKSVRLHGLTSARANALRSTAEQMTSFPLGVWIHASRGCGCLVGEHIIEQDVLDRESAADQNANLQLLLDVFWPGEGSALLNFGLLLDCNIIDELIAHGVVAEQGDGDENAVEVVVIEEDEASV